MVSIQLDIDWADLDLYGHVNNVAYYRYMQSARIAFCDLVGLTVLAEPDKLSFILAASHCNYKTKLHFPGKITVETRVSSINNSSFHLAHTMYDPQGTLAATGGDVLVIYDYAAGSKMRIPGPLLKQLEWHHQRGLNTP